ncbi:MAG: hypothetical protein Kow0067_13050 [Coriobacteriia bacterium]
MELRHNPRPLWTERHLDMLQLYGPACMGEAVPPDALAAERRAIAAGHPRTRAIPSALIFDVYSDTGKLVGEIALTRAREEAVEIHVLVFDDCKGQHVATEAICHSAEMLETQGVRCIEAAVRLLNPNLRQMHHILTGLGFVRQIPTPPTVVYRYHQPGGAV